MRICSVEGCGKKHNAKGLCFNHYKRTFDHRYWKSHYTLEEAIEAFPKVFEYDMAMARYYVKGSIDEEDIRQEIMIIWHQAISLYYSHQRKIPLKFYLMLYNKYYIKDRMRYIARHNRTVQQPTMEQTTEETIDLGLEFLIKGSSKYPLSTLSNYDRLLLYLMFYRDMSGRQIAKELKRYKATIFEDIRDLMDYLRREWIHG